MNSSLCFVGFFGQHSIKTLVSRGELSHRFGRHEDAFGVQLFFLQGCHGFHGRKEEVWGLNGHCNWSRNGMLSLNWVLSRSLLSIRQLPRNYCLLGLNGRSSAARHHPLPLASTAWIFPTRLFGAAVAVVWWQPCPRTTTVLLYNHVPDFHLPIFYPFPPWRHINQSWLPCRCPQVFRGHPLSYD